MTSETTAEREKESPQLEQPAGHRSTYVRTGVGKLKEPSDSPLRDGAALVQQCVKMVSDTNSFPPKLFILFLTPSFNPYRPVLLGVRNKLADLGFGDVPLIGSSVAVCLFDEMAHERGALLVCLASRFITAKAALGSNAQDQHEKAVENILKELGLVEPNEMNPRGNRFLFTFLPGLSEAGEVASYRAGEILETLRRRTHARLPMWGGVSSAGLTPGAGSQFMMDGVHIGAAVVAMVKCEVMCGIGLAQGLVDTGQAFRVAGIADNGHVITKFQEGTPEKIMAELPKDACLGQYSPDGDLVATAPELKNGNMHMRRSFSNRSVLHLFVPDSNGIVKPGEAMVQRVMGRTHMRNSRIAAILGIGCVARYRHRNQLGLNVSKAIHRATDIFPGVAFAGCYMDGEVGLDSLGRSVLGNWSLSVALFADDMPERSEVSLGFDTVARGAAAVGKARTLEEVIDCLLGEVSTIGYPGCMLSLVLRHQDSQWIVARKAFGKTWQQNILPLTRRKLPGRDILAIVAREGRPRYIRDSRDPEESCDSTAVEAGGTLSQYIIPLSDDKGVTIGILQVDLGDMRDSPVLGHEQTVLLDAFGSMAAAALSRVIRTEELEISKKLDRALIECLSADLPGQAASRFMASVTQALGAEGHVRLCLPGSNKLRLVGGVGPYATAAAAQRRDITLDDNSPSAETVRRNLSVLCNDTEQDKNAQIMRSRFSHGPLAGPIQRMGSYANFPISLRGQQPKGVISVCSERPWFFTEANLRSLANVGERLCVLLTHIEHRREAHQSNMDAQFLREITPALDPGRDLYAALRSQVEQLRIAAKAEVVSCFLWDETLGRFVLRAEAGWADKRWVDAAWYTMNEGMTGKLANSTIPRYIPDLIEFKKETQEQTGKYIRAMFGGPVTGHTYEVLALPLHFGGKPLGIVTMHHKRVLPLDESDTAFATCNEGILSEAAECLSSFVTALEYHDKANWERLEMDRLAQIGQVLLSDLPFVDKLYGLCQKVNTLYESLQCAIFLASNDRKSLKLVARTYRSPQEDVLPGIVKAGEDPLWGAFATGKYRDERRPVADRQDDPKQVRNDLQITRVCMPLCVDKESIGAIDIHWHGTQRKRAGAPRPRHDPDYLMRIATQVAFAISAHQLRSERKKAKVSSQQSQRALDGMAMALRRSFHDLAKGVQGVQSGLNRLMRRHPTPEQITVLSGTRDVLQELRHVLEKARNVGYRLKKMARSRCRLDKLVHEAVGKYRTDAKNANVEIICDVPPISANVDGAQMLECFENVIDNAIKAMPHGGRLDICIRHHEDGYCVLLSDTGIGMSQEKIQRLLSGESDQNVPTRSGIGLFLTRLYCESHGGGLAIDSSLGAGTTVTLDIPFARTERS